MKKFWKDNSETITVVLALSLCLAGLFFAQSHRHAEGKTETKKVDTLKVSKKL